MKDDLIKQFTLLSPCERCYSMKIGCNRQISCDGCGDRHACVPSEQEPIKRAREIMKGLTTGTYFHNDVLKYQIYLQHSRCHSRSFLRHTEVRDIYKRLSDKYSERKTKFHATLEKLPQCFQDILKSYTTYKLEWMYGGEYLCYTSPSYSQNIMSHVEIEYLAKKYSLPPKLVDSGNTGISDIMFRVWNESLFTPLVEASVQVPVFWRQKGEVAWTKIMMFSWISGHDGILSMTLMNRVTRIILP